MAISAKLGQYYLLFTAGLAPLLLPPALLEPFEPEKNFVTSSDMSGSSGLGLNMFMDCSISCRDIREIDHEQTNQCEAG